jgi:Flp pilus assembly protein protease CpaA
MYEMIFLWALALIWIIFATVQDLRTREIANWLNFSLIIFALGFRFFYSLFVFENFVFFYQGLIGLLIFFFIGNILYYGRLFAGGDAKLMIALGAVLPFSGNFSDNLKLFAYFLLIFLFIAAFYSLIFSLVLALKNFKSFRKEFNLQVNKYKKIVYSVMLLGLVLMAFGLFETIFLSMGILVFILPYFYIYAKAVDETSMIKKISTRKLVEGDWLYKDLKIGNKKIKARWEGLRKEEIARIRKKYKTILVRQGIPFAPVFLISFLILIYFWKSGLWNSLW